MLQFRYLILLIIVPAVFYGQSDLLKNGGFESRSGNPNGAAQFHLVNNWESRNHVAPDDNTLHSPDYLTNQTKARSGEGYVGVFDYELFQQELSGALSSERLYLAKFHFSRKALGPNGETLPDLDGSLINIYVARDRVYYKEETESEARSECSSDYKDKFYPPLANQKIKLVESIDPAQFPFDTWLEHSFVFTVEDNLYEYFIVEVVFKDPNSSGQINCSKSYILFDDFSLVDFCNSDCQPETLDNDIETRETPVDNKIQVKQDDQSTLFYVLNAQRIRIQLINRWGAVWEKEYFDPMGLHNASNRRPNESAFAITWGGQWVNNEWLDLNDGEVHIFTYHIVIDRCGSSSLEFNGNLTFVAQNNGSQSEIDDWYDTWGVQYNYSPPLSLSLNCCEVGDRRYTEAPENRAFEPVHIDGSIVFDGDMHFPAIGQEFLASEFIEINPDFSAKAIDFENGVQILHEFGIKETCSSEPAASGGEEQGGEGSGKKEQEQFKTDVQFSNVKNGKIEIFPNPLTENDLEIQGVGENTIVEILDVSGALIMRHELNSGNNSVSFAHLEPSLYFVIIRSLIDQRIKETFKLVRN